MRILAAFALLFIAVCISLSTGSFQLGINASSQSSSEMVVTIRSINENTYLHWVTAEGGGGTWVKTVPALTRNFYKFILVDRNGGRLLPGDRVYLRTPNNNTPTSNMFVRLHPDGVIKADIAVTHERGEFKITNLTRPGRPIEYDDWIALQAFGDNQWWVANSGDDGKVKVETVSPGRLNRRHYFQLCNPDNPTGCREYNPNPPPPPTPTPTRPSNPEQIKYQCSNVPIESGWVITGQSISPSCGHSTTYNYLRLKRPGDRELVCFGSPVPQTHRGTGQRQLTTDCYRQSPDSYSAFWIERRQ